MAALVSGPAGVAAPRPVIHDGAWWLAPSVEVNVMSEFLALHEALKTSEHMRWMGECQCILADNPDEWSKTSAAETVMARRVCSRCPVAQECFDYAMAHPDVSGVWGGTTQRERTAAHRVHNDRAKKGHT